MKNTHKEEFKDTRHLMSKLPADIVAIFVASIIAMNILANKTIFENEFIALDGGILVSWISFLCMDIITKCFGPKASIKISLFAIFVSTCVFAIFFLVSLIPTISDFSAFNTVVGGTWFILLSSVIAMIVSSLANIMLNHTIGMFFKEQKFSKIEFVFRSYISTFLGQFVDNLTFSLLTFMLFAPIFWDGFCWTFVQCLSCSIFGAITELIMEVIFSPIGYKTIKVWQKNNIGEEYLIKEEK